MDMWTIFTWMDLYVFYSFVQACEDALKTRNSNSSHFQTLIPSVLIKNDWLRVLFLRLFAAMNLSCFRCHLKVLGRGCKKDILLIQWISWSWTWFWKHYLLDWRDELRHHHTQNNDINNNLTITLLKEEKALRLGPANWGSSIQVKISSIAIYNQN